MNFKENFLKSSLFNIFNLALEKNCSQEWMFLKWIELIKNNNSKMALTIVDKGIYITILFYNLLRVGKIPFFIFYVDIKN